MRYTNPSPLRQMTAMLATWLLIVTILPLYPAGTVRAFMPTNSTAGGAGAGGSSTHESITFDVIKDYDKVLFQLGNKDLTENMKKAQTEIINANTDVDSIFGVQFTKSASHFDGENFQGSQKRLIDYKLKVKELMLKKKVDVSKARWYLGQALHTLQDFYSHSNWVELGNGSPYAVLGVPGNPLTNPPDSTRTCTDCTRDHCTDCYNPATGLTNLTTTAVTTGYYGGDDRTKPNDFKCSHGGKVSFVGGIISSKDSSSKGTLGSGINKDTKKCQISPHNDKHVAAATVAKAATKKYLDDIKTLIKVSKMKLLLGGGTTMAMSIDTTGSMGGIIAQVKQQAIQIVDSRIGTDEEPTKYVLAPFSDPGVGPVTVTDDPDEFKAAISSLTADAGGDCPELAMTGMLQALNNMDEDGGELLMFTDASSKDGGLTSTVDSVALSKNIKISPIAFGSCSPIDPGYIKLANDTGGQLFVLSGSEAGNITQLADFVIRSNVVDLLYISSTLAGVPQTYDVPVDSTMTRVTFSVSGTANVVVRRPDNSVVQPSDANVSTVVLSSGAIYSIATPVTGEWHITVNGSDVFSLRAIGESPLDFSFFNFVELQGRPVHEGYFRIAGFPSANQPATIMAQVSANANTASFTLRNPDGTTLQPISLTELGWANDDPDESSFTVGPVRQFLGDISTPGTSFRAYVTGVDLNGFPYQRVRSGITKAQTVTITRPPSVDLTPGQPTNYIFAVTNLGPPDTFSLIGADDNNFLSSISPTTVTLGTNETTNISVLLLPPATAGDNALDTLTVTVQSTGASEASNYARVKSLVKPTTTLVFDSVTTSERGGNANGIIESGEGGTVNASLVNIGDNIATGLSVTLSSSTPGVTIESGLSAYPDIAPADLGFNITPLTFNLDSTVLCGQNISLTLTATQTGSNSTTVFNFPVQVGQPASLPDAPTTVSYAGPPAPIPDANIAGVNVPLTVSGFTGAIADLNFSFDGTSCTTAPQATTVGLDHTWVGDLVVTLTSPQGKTVSLINQPDFGGNSGNNFCNTLLDDQSTGRSIQEVVSADAPHTGSFKPDSPLEAFKGENPNGTWILNVSDRAFADVGKVRAFSLIISATRCDTVTTSEADLALSETASPNPVLTGSNLTYTLTVSNNGPGSAQNVVVTDDLPVATAFVSCSVTGTGVCAGTGNNRTVSFPSLAAGASETIAMVVSVNCPLTNETAITNNATVSSDTADPNSTNNSAVTTVIASNPAPTISEVSANPSLLWPPNHNMVDVTVNYAVTDNCGPVTNTLSVTSNEPVNGTGDGNTDPDWVIVDANHVQLRAERAGSGTGRIYTIQIVSTDSAGNTMSTTVTVQVSHDGSASVGSSNVNPGFSEFLLKGPISTGRRGDLLRAYGGI